MIRPTSSATRALVRTTAAATSARWANASHLSSIRHGGVCRRYKSSRPSAAQVYEYPDAEAVMAEAAAEAKENSKSRRTRHDGGSDGGTTELSRMRSSSSAVATIRPTDGSIMVPQLENVTEMAPAGKEKGDATAAVATHVEYTSGVRLPLTPKLQLLTPQDQPPHPWPVFRLLEEDGSIRPDVYPEDVDALITHNVMCDMDTALRTHRFMARLNQMDTIYLNAQRQGRISFYMSCRGEESIHFGAAAALQSQDVILAQYREAGLLMWRGFTLEQFADQCFSNCKDLGRGRQMPIHYGSRALNYHTISSPLGTQIPQAVGVGYKMKLDNAKLGPDATDEDRACAVTFFGDGAASTGDFHYACNFAATLDCPVLFVCRNNGFAISTPVAEQYAGDGIIGRAPGYGMAAIRVDGNDALAVSVAMREARRYAVTENKPVMVEMMTYRQADHSTSDDSTRYRCVHEVKSWSTDGRDPITRFVRFLVRQGWMSSEEDHVAVADEERLAVMKSMEAGEKKDKPKLDTLFRDVYKYKTKGLERQEKELHEHMDRHKDFYA